VRRRESEFQIYIVFFSLSHHILNRGLKEKIKGQAVFVNNPLFFFQIGIFMDSEGKKVKAKLGVGSFKLSYKYTV
jgi:hypothetical protein